MRAVMRVLCTGDIHIGRRPTRVPDEADAARVSTAAVWSRIVAQAIAQRVDVVVLTGDVVDRDNRFFEALGPLEAGLRQLAGAGIETFAVAGNHDYDVLPRLCESVGAERFHLLGVGGRWQRFVLRRNDRPLLNVDGWSFPALHVRHNPLDGYDLPPTHDAPTIGLLHTDLDQHGSPYAPTALADLRRIPVTLWLLGHVHEARYDDGAGLPAVLNPGSPQPLDPGEPGPHGPWLVAVETAGACRAEHVPLATVRYERLEIDVSDIADLPAFEQRVPAAVLEHARGVLSGAGAPEHLVYRVRLSGRTRLHGDLAGAAQNLVRDWRSTAGHATVSVETVRNDTQPDVDLVSLARGRDAAACLARLLLAADQPQLPQEYDGLRARIGQALSAVNAARPYQALKTVGADRSTPDGEALQRLLTSQGRLLLDALLGQKAGEP